MKKRIAGLETEFGVLPFDEEDDKAMFRILAESLKRKFLPNGGLVYADLYHNSGDWNNGNEFTVTHPEYATPEILIPDNLGDLIAYDKAGELILAGELPGLKLFKNNEDDLDFSGEISYADFRNRFGCHENYSLYRGDFSFFNLVDKGLPRLEPFFIARQLIHGNGSIVNGDYHLSQKAKFIQFSPKQPGLFWVHTSSGEPLAGDYDRLHGYHSDSNMCEMADYLKVGLTALMLDLLEKGKLPDIILDERYGDYLDMIYSIPFDRLHEWKLKVLLNNKRVKMGAFEIFDAYLERVMLCRGEDWVTDDVLARTIQALDCLKNDPMKLAGWFDYIEKKRLLDEFMAAEGLGLEDRWVKSVALQYHDIDRRAGLFYALQSAGKTERVTTSEKILKAVTTPPRDTRAWGRGNILGRWGERINRADWTGIELILGKLHTHETGKYVLRLDDPFNSYDEKLLELEKMMN